MDSKSTSIKNSGHAVKFLLLAVATMTMAVGSNAYANDERWAELQSMFFGDRPISSGDEVISMVAPKRAHDAATVPIVIKALDPNLRINQVHLIVDKNPVPLAGVFKLHEAASDWNSLETRIRINEYTHVRAVAELSDGSLHMTTRFIKAAGGCSAPAMADMDAAMARAGKMQVKLNSIEDGDTSTSEAIIKISHPNNSGMQFDQVSRNYIPAFFVHKIAADLNGSQLIDIDTNFSMSENPVVRLNFTPRPDLPQSTTEMLVYAEDSKGNRFEKSLATDSSVLAKRTN